MAENCGSCRFCAVFFCTGKCTNPNSVFVNEFVGRNFYCRQWMKKENTNGKKKNRGGA